MREKLPVGEAVREFYSSLEKIEDLYYKKGYRKLTYLFNKLKEDLKLKMSYHSFRYHFNIHFKNSKNEITPKENKNIDLVQEIITPKENKNSSPINKDMLDMLEKHKKAKDIFNKGN